MQPTLTFLPATTAPRLALQKVASVEVPRAKPSLWLFGAGFTLCVKLAEHKISRQKLYPLASMSARVKKSPDGIERAEKLGITPIILDAKQRYQQWLTKPSRQTLTTMAIRLYFYDRQLIAAIVAKKSS